MVPGSSTIVLPFLLLLYIRFLYSAFEDLLLERLAGTLLLLELFRLCLCIQVGSSYLCFRSAWSVIFRVAFCVALHDALVLGTSLWNRLLLC